MLNSRTAMLETRIEDFWAKPRNKFMSKKNALSIVRATGFVGPKDYLDRLAANAIKHNRNNGGTLAVAVRETEDGDFENAIGRPRGRDRKSQTRDGWLRIDSMDDGRLVRHIQHMEQVVAFQNKGIGPVLVRLIEKAEARQLLDPGTVGTKRISMPVYKQLESGEA